MADPNPRSNQNRVVSPELASSERHVVSFLEHVRRHFAWPIWGWFVVLSPLLVVALACQVPSMLEGLVIVRTESTRVFQLDIVLLTAMSGVVCAYGIAIVRLVDLYGALRFRRSQSLKSIHNPTEVRRTDWLWWKSDSSAWPVSLWILWLLMSVSYSASAYWLTIRCLRRSLNTTAFDSIQTNVVLLLGIGLLIAMGWLFLISLIHTALTRTSTSICGMFPMEDVVAELFDRWFGKVSKAQVSDKSFKWFWKSPGFTEPDSTSILPGHIQMTVMLLMGAVLYGYLFYSSYGGAGWPPQQFPVGAYALLLAFIVGAIAAWASFLLGRHRIRLELVVLAVLLFGWFFGGWIHVDTNRYFQLLSEAPKTPIELNWNEAEAKTTAKPTFVRALEERLGARKANATTAPEPSETLETKRKTLYELLTDEKNPWEFPAASDNKRTMVVVATSGGGIQSAAWTAKVLCGFDRLFSTFSESIGLISSVSGGSVGTMYYVGHRGYRTGAETPLHIAESQRAKIEEMASGSALEAVGWGFAFPDFARSVLPFPMWDPEIDRGWALESQWWNRMGPDAGYSAAMKELRMRDLIPATNRGQIPPLILNATAVETGQRMMISTIATAFAKTPDPSAVGSITAADYENPTMPIDFFDYYEPLFKNPQRVNPRISTAVRLSSSFAYVTPVTKPIAKKEDLKEDLAKEYASRLEMHVCDGGYSDNSGLVAAIRVVADTLKEFKAAKKQPPFQRILFINIESFPENPVVVPKDETGLRSGFFGPLVALNNARVSSQSERTMLELELLVGANQAGFDEMGDRNKLSLFNEFETTLAEMQSVGQSVVDSIDENSASEDLLEVRDSLATVANQFNADLPKDGKSKEVLVRRAKNLAEQVLEKSPDWTNKVQGHLPEESVSKLQELESYANKLKDQGEKLPKVADVEFELDVAITSLQIRFNPDMQWDGNGNALPPKTQIEAPPLSWRLSPHDQYRIEQAWQAQNRRLKSEAEKGLADSSDKTTHSETAPAIASAGPDSSDAAKRKDNHSKENGLLPPAELGKILQMR